MDLSPSASSLWICLYCLGVVAIALVLSYIFYPAYTNAEGGLGCTVTILAGEECDQGKRLQIMHSATSVIFTHVYWS